MNGYEMTIYKIFNSYGKNQQDWAKFYREIKETNQQRSYNISCVITAQLCNFKHIELCLDIIDYIMDYGTEEIISKISDIPFKNNIISLLEYGLSDKIKNKILFLIAKWGSKNTNYKSAYSYLKNDLNFEFPTDNMTITTYIQYIGANNHNISKNDSNTKRKPERANSSFKVVKTKNYLPVVYESAFCELINQREQGDSILKQIRDFRFDIAKKLKVINNKIDKANCKTDIVLLEKQVKMLKNDDGLRCENLLRNSEEPYQKLFLNNVKNDIESTVKRYEKLIQGLKPELFLSLNKY